MTELKEPELIAPLDTPLSAQQVKALLQANVLLRCHLATRIAHQAGTNQASLFVNGEAWRIIEECRGWNTSQKSTTHIFEGCRSSEDDILDAKRAALAEAWRVING